MLNIGHLGTAVTNEHIMQKLAWQMVNLPLEAYNAFANWYLAFGSEHPEAISGMAELMRLASGRIKDVSQMKKGSGPILAVGSGSSLDTVISELKDWKHPIICSTSQASTLIHYGRVPEYICCLDPKMAPADELAAPDWGNAALLGHVSMPHGYVAQWLHRAKGMIYVGRIMEPTYDWYSHHLGQGYPWIRHVILPMIDSMAAEISFATWLGYNPIYIIGCDYYGPRMKQWNWQYDTKTWAVDEALSGLDVKTIPRGFQAMNYSSRGALLSAFMQIVNAKYQQRIYQLSDKSVLTQFPFRKWKDVLENRVDESPYPRKTVLDEIEIALSIWDTFVVPIPGGWGTDYHTYIANDDGSFAAAMTGYNNQVVNNKKDFENLEKQHGQPVQKMIETGQISIEAGDLLLHGAEEFGDWDWRKMDIIDIGAMLVWRKWLLAEAKKKGYTKEGSKMAEALAEIQEIEGGIA